MQDAICFFCINQGKGKNKYTYLFKTIYINKENVKIFKNSGICFCTYLGFCLKSLKNQHGGSFLASSGTSRGHLACRDALLTIAITWTHSGVR